MNRQVKCSILAVLVLGCLGAGYQVSGQSRQTVAQSPEPIVSQADSQKSQHTRDWNNVPLR